MMDENIDLIKAAVAKRENQKIIGLIEKEAGICLDCCINHDDGFTLVKPMLENAASSILYLAGKLKEQ